MNRDIKRQRKKGTEKKRRAAEQRKKGAHAWNTRTQDTCVVGSEKQHNAKWKASEKKKRKTERKATQEERTSTPHMERENTHADEKHKQTGPPDPPESTKRLHTNGSRKKEKKRKRPAETTKTCRHTRNMYRRQHNNTKGNAHTRTHETENEEDTTNK